MLWALVGLFTGGVGWIVHRAGKRPEPKRKPKPKRRGKRK